MKMQNLVLSFFLFCAISSIAQNSSPEELFNNFRDLYRQEKYKEAAIPAREAAEKGYAPAQFALGTLYLGRGVEKDYESSVMWYRKAAEQGFAEAENSLGDMYFDGLGVTQDYQEALTWYHKAAAQGNAESAFSLGLMYTNGLGVAKDNEEAVKWYRKAADQGDAKAENATGVMYYRGLGVPQDYNEAIKWFHKAANQGNVSAQNNLGKIYSNGEIPINLNEAKRWFQKAAAQGNEDAKIKLAEIENIASAGDNAEPLGFKLGATPLNDIKKIDVDMKFAAYSHWTGGERWESTGKVHNIEGLKGVIYIFNKISHLDVIKLTMNKDYFDKINKYLKSKYTLISQSIPPVGDKFVKYKQGNSIIEINAPHLNFEMTVTYKTTAFDRVFNQQVKKEKQSKEQEQKAKF